MIPFPRSASMARRVLFPVLATVFCLVAGSRGLAAQGGGTQGGGLYTLPVDARTVIQGWYADHTRPGAESLPPGIRRRLQRGKPLPPGIARRTTPPELVGRVSLPRGFELVEVGLDVLVVETATRVVHDVLSSVISPGTRPR